MKTLDELKEAAEAHGWQVNITRTNSIMLGNIGAGESKTFVFDPGEDEKYQFKAIRGDEEATIATGTYLYACIWPRMSDFEKMHGAHRTALRSYPKNDPSDYPEASEWLYYQLCMPEYDGRPTSRGWQIINTVAKTFTVLTLIAAAFALFVLCVVYYQMGQGWYALVIGLAGTFFIIVDSVMIADLIKPRR